MIIGILPKISITENKIKVTETISLKFNSMVVSLKKAQNYYKFIKFFKGIYKLLFQFAKSKGNGDIRVYILKIQILFFAKNV